MHLTPFDIGADVRYRSCSFFLDPRTNRCRCKGRHFVGMLCTCVHPAEARGIIGEILAIPIDYVIMLCLLASSHEYFVPIPTPPYFCHMYSLHMYRSFVWFATLGFLLSSAE